MIPSEINLLGTTFKVEMESLSGKTGDTKVWKRRIRIHPDTPPDTQVETFYHELMHVILGHLGLDNLVDSNTEEAICQGVGMALTYLVSTNQLPSLGQLKGETK